MCICGKWGFKGYVPVMGAYPIIFQSSRFFFSQHDKMVGWFFRQAFLFSTEWVGQQKGPLTKLIIDPAETEGELCRVKKKHIFKLVSSCHYFTGDHGTMCDLIIVPTLREYLFKVQGTKRVRANQQGGSDSFSLRRWGHLFCNLRTILR